MFLQHRINTALQESQQIDMFVCLVSRKSDLHFAGRFCLLVGEGSLYRMRAPTILYFTPSLMMYN